MEEPMKERIDGQTEYAAAAPATDVTYWMTEYQRVFLMTAARIRGRPVSSGARIELASIPARRDWDRLERVTAARAIL
jgi:hypothetical protein